LEWWEWWEAAAATATAAEASSEAIRAGTARLSAVGCLEKPETVGCLEKPETVGCLKKPETVSDGGRGTATDGGEEGKHKSGFLGRVPFPRSVELESAVARELTQGRLSAEKSVGSRAVPVEAATEAVGKVSGGSGSRAAKCCKRSSDTSPSSASATDVSRLFR
jgi:hypothetical protein